MKQETILSKAALLWWESLDDYKKQAILLNNNFTGVLVTDEWKVKCYNAEHPATPIADLTGDKVFDSPVSLFLRQENNLLKERIKVLREALQSVREIGGFNPDGIIGKCIKAALEQTK